jgi:hypothetical protein
VTNLQSLASSSTFQAGWTSAYVDNTSNLNLNSVAYGQITAGFTPDGRQRARLYVRLRRHERPDVHQRGHARHRGGADDHGQRAARRLLVLIWSSDIDTTTNDVYPMPPRSVRQAFGFYPRNWALYVSHNTVAALKSSGNAMYADHELAQYT